MVAEWVPVPSLGYKYEVTPSGKLRNAATKQILKKTSHTYYHLTINQKSVCATIANLLWEAHGILPERRTKRDIPVTIQKDKTILHFKNITMAAAYLSKTEFYNAKYVREFFSKRVAELWGWKITYHLPDKLAQVKYKIPTLTRRRKKNKL